MLGTAFYGPAATQLTSGALPGREVGRASHVVWCGPQSFNYVVAECVLKSERHVFFGGTTLSCVPSVSDHAGVAPEVLGEQVEDADCVGPRRDIVLD